MSDANIFLSNGTCYLAAGVEAHKAMIPCGNSYYYGPLTCCQQGDVCLANNACFNAEFKTTYLAGCSDPEYEDASCPDKGTFVEEPWIGLVYCNETSNEWTGCAQSDSSPTLAKPDHCWCPDPPRAIAFSAGPTLIDRVKLGSALLESVVYYPGHAPTARLTSGGAPVATAPPAATTDSQVSSEETSPTTPTPTSAPVETAPASSDTAKEEGLPAGVGIGIGVGVGSVVVLAVVGLLLFLRRRRRRQRDSDLAAGANAAEKPDSAGVENLPPPQPPALGTPELDSRGARPWSMRSELPDTPRSIAAEMESPVQVAIHADNARHHAHPPPSHPSVNGRPQNGPIAELP